MTERTIRARQWKKFRKKHLFTQARLAQVLGMSRSAIQKIERGACDASATTLSKFEALKSRYIEQKEFWKNARESFSQSVVGSRNTEGDSRQDQR